MSKCRHKKEGLCSNPCYCKDLAQFDKSVNYKDRTIYGVCLEEDDF